MRLRRYCGCMEMVFRSGFDRTTKRRSKNTCTRGSRFRHYRLVLGRITITIITQRPDSRTARNKTSTNSRTSRAANALRHDKQSIGTSLIARRALFTTENGTAAAATEARVPGMKSISIRPNKKRLFVYCSFSTDSSSPVSSLDDRRYIRVLSPDANCTRSPHTERTPRQKKIRSVYPLAALRFIILNGRADTIIKRYFRTESKMLISQNSSDVSYDNF